MSGKLPSHLSSGLESQDPAQLLDAIRECLRMETEEAASALTEVLRSDRPAELRSQAARALGVCAGEDAEEAFLGIASGDLAPWLRITCIDILGWIGSPGMAHELLSMIDSCPKEISVVVLDAVREIGRLSEADSHILERQLGAPEPEIRVAAAFAISAQTEVTRHESALTFAANDGDPLVRVAASLGLARAQSDHGAKAWKEAWQSTPPRARQQVLRVLRDARSDETRRLLEPLIDVETEPALWRELAMALAESRSPVIAEAVADRLIQGSRDPILALALAEVGNAMGEHLLRLEASSAASNHHHLVARALCLLGHQEITQQYAELLDSPAGSERRTAAFNLAASGSRQALQVLLDTLDFAYLRERRQALRLITDLYDLGPDTLPDVHVPRRERRQHISRLREILEGEPHHVQAARSR